MVSVNRVEGKYVTGSHIWRLGVSKDERPWVALKDVHHLYGMTLESARNAIAAGTFPVCTYKLGRSIVIDRVVHEEFFARQRERGLRALREGIEPMSNDN